MTNYRDKLITEIADKQVQEISRRIISQLEEMTDLLAGEDSGLENTWEEICVQVQFGQSNDWDAYESTIIQILDKELKSLPHEFMQAIWLQTEDGEEWTFEVDDDETEDKRSIYPCENHVSEYIKGKILTEAMNYSNDRISNFFESSRLNEYD